MSQAQCIAKFHCNSLTLIPGSEEDPDNTGKFRSVENEEFKMSAIMADDEIEENSRFSHFTPFGAFEGQVNNSALKGLFRPGVDYYIEVRVAPRDLQAIPEAYDRLPEKFKV